MSAEDQNAHCRILPNYEVEHWDCDEYPRDGTVTSVLTGKVVR